MIRAPRYQHWPDLVYRSERLADVMRQEHHAAFMKDAEDEFVKHVRECPNCRKKVAMLARSGAKLSARVLQAAGVEVLN